MKLVKHLLFSLLILTGSAFSTIAQSIKEIALSNVQKTVPEGKVWFISNEKTSMILFRREAFRSGTLCNSSLRSNPRHTFGIAYYDAFEKNSRPKTVGFTFNSLEETFGSNVYLIKPYFLIENGIHSEDLVQSLSWKYKPSEIVLYPGSSVFTTGCISEITVFERDMTSIDKEEYNRRVTEMENAKKRALEYEKKREEERVREEWDRFDNPTTIYNLRELDNFNALKIDTSPQEEILQSIMNAVNSQEKADYEQFFKHQIQISVTWDSLGNAVDIFFSPTKTSYGSSSSPVQDLKVSEESLEKLKAVLTLNIAPEISLGDKKRQCFVNGNLLLFSYANERKTDFGFRRSKDKWRGLAVTHKQNRQDIEKFLNNTYLSYPVGERHYMIYYETRFNFTLQKGIFSSEDVEIKENSWAVHPQ